MCGVVASYGEILSLSFSLLNGGGEQGILSTATRTFSVGEDMEILASFILLWDHVLPYE